MPSVLYKDPANIHVEDMIIGSDSYDGLSTFAVAGQPPLAYITMNQGSSTEIFNDTQSWLQTEFGEQAGAALWDAYAPPNSGFPDSDLATFINIDADGWGVCSGLNQAAIVSQKASGQVYSYLYAHHYAGFDVMTAFVDPIPDVNYAAWTSHGSEVPVLFGNPVTTFTAQDEAVHAAFMGYFANFAKTGNPNIAGARAAEWMPVTDASLTSAGGFEVPYLYIHEGNTGMRDGAAKAADCELILEAVNQQQNISETPSTNPDSNNGDSTTSSSTPGDMQVSETPFDSPNGDSTSSGNVTGGILEWVVVALFFAFWI